MIALWMLGALLTGALVGAAALAAERAVRLWRGPTRWVWAIALAAAALLPAAAVLLPRVLDGTGEAGAGVAPTMLAPVVVVGAGEGLRTLAERLAPLDTPLAVGWALLSALAVARLARGALTLRRARRRWRAADVDATSVLVAPRAGPLVVGVRRPHVVLPEWALALDAPRRALVVRHEAEHARARDPALLLAAATAVALVPWNLALWWHARRLRLAVEVDCDARVLRAHPDVRRYALLLVDVARRAATRHPTLAAALAEPPSDLERRIAAMQSTRPRHRVLRTFLLGGVAGAAVLGAFAACSASDLTSPPLEPAPPPPTPAAEVAVRSPRRAPPVVDNGPYFEFQVEQPVVPAPGNRGPRYPELLKATAVEGEVLAQFVVDPDGQVDIQSFKVLKSTHDLFTQAVRSSLVEARYLPARVGGKAVRQLVQQPFQFQLTK
jgi:TonB family protein